MKKSVKGFTLAELLVVLVIIGILILLALPSLVPLITRTRALEAKKGLAHIHTLQKTYFMEYSKYSSDLTQLGWEQEPLSTEEGGTSNYRFELAETDNSHYVAKAVAVVDFDNDGTFNTWEINQDNILKELVKD